MKKKKKDPGVCERGQRIGKGKPCPSDAHLAALVSKTLREQFAGFNDYEIDGKDIDGLCLRARLTKDRKLAYPK